MPELTAKDMPRSTACKRCIKCYVKLDDDEELCHHCKEENKEETTTKSS